MLKKLLNERCLPSLMSREEMLGILQSEVYGKIPTAPETLSFDVEENYILNFCAGKSVCNKITAHCTLYGLEFSFPFYVTIPIDDKKHPFFIHINFRDCVPDRYMPTEELVDNGFAVLSFSYNDITADNDDFTDGLAGILYKEGKRKSDDAGKIAMWTWAAHRVMDYAQTLGDKLDLNNAIVCGHSRLGKTALLTAATDERFAFAYSNNSGCTGAAISRKKNGEQIKDICERYSYWFCKNYQKYINNEENMPFDQHFLISSIAPRKVLIGSASEDYWADPVSEQLCCMAASNSFKNGFICDKLAEIGDEFFEGDLGYHLRKGLHYFSREDWLKLIKFFNKHKN